MHDTISVTEVQGFFEQFEHIIANIVISQSRVESFEVRIVDVFENEGGSLRLGITHNIVWLNNVPSSTWILQDFYLTFDLLR